MSGCYSSQVMPLAGHLWSLQSRRQDVTPLHSAPLQRTFSQDGATGAVSPQQPSTSTLDHPPPSIKTVKNTSEGPGPAGFIAAGVTGFSFSFFFSKNHLSNLSEEARPRTSDLEDVTRWRNIISQFKGLRGTKQELRDSSVFVCEP